ncbi:hypothetical protein JKF63_06242 [Porcisia hertigi]|uniref:Uncharacterized protein n=1 Tax=Porcisia hertigi TaxID=2761500 RepID=A0A836ING7_9TRYP|nr:hypothetical protein JKF63_06242 [Porcisia hertigi]
MAFRVAAVSRAARSLYPPVAITGRCFLLKPGGYAALATRSQQDSSPLHDMECVDLTSSESSMGNRRGAVPVSLAGNGYYARRYSSRGATRRGALGATESDVQFRSGDLVLRLCFSAVPRELAHKRIVDVTGLQTSFHNASEKRSHALATVEEAVKTMHLHDGYEVPAVQRGNVNLVRLQPGCVYVPPPPPSLVPPHPPGAGGTPVVSLRHLYSALRPLRNPDVLLAQTRRLSFRCEMEAVQTAQVMASHVMQLKGCGSFLRGHGASFDAMSSAAILRPVVCDGHLVAMTLCPSPDPGCGGGRRRTGGKAMNSQPTSRQSPQQ